MISIFHSGRTLVLNIRHGLDCEDRNIQLQKQFCDDREAAAVAKVLNDFLNDRVQAFAQRNYERGWKDAKAKRRKDSYFPSWIKPE